MAGRIIVDADRCKGCGLCEGICRRKCIAMSHTSNTMDYFPAQAKGTDCTACANCAVVCPEAAIEVYQGAENELT